MLLWATLATRLLLATAFTWQACQEASAPRTLTPTAVDVEPSDVKRGGSLNVSLTVILSTDGPAISGGVLSATVIYLGIRVCTVSADLCNGIHCPVLPGEERILSTAQSFPWWAPRGSYTLRFEGSTRDPVSHEEPATSGTAGWIDLKEFQQLVATKADTRIHVTQGEAKVEVVEINGKFVSKVGKLADSESRMRPGHSRKALAALNEGVNEHANQEGPGHMMGHHRVKGNNSQDVLCVEVVFDVS